MTIDIIKAKQVIAALHREKEEQLLRLQQAAKVKSKLEIKSRNNHV